MTPTLSYSYDRHTVADLRLPAISRQCARIQAGGEDDAYNGRMMQCMFTIRLHEAYGNDPVDGQYMGRLCNSVVNKIFLNFDVMQAAGATLVGIGDIRTSVSFTESDTVGAELEVTYMIEQQYTQES